MNRLSRLRDSAWPGTLFLLGLLLTWEVAARQIASPNFPGALTVLSKLGEVGPALLREMGVTLWRAAAGLLLALVTMLPLGVFIGRFRALGDFIEPVIDMLRPLPPLAIVPVAMLFAGVGSGAKVMVIFYSVSFPIILSAIDAVRGAHPMLSNVARSLRMSRREIMLEIDLPAALPQVMVGIRIAVALAILISVSTEMLLSTDGIGNFIMRSQEEFQIAAGMAALIVIAVTALIINGVVEWIDRRALRWHYAKQASTTSN
ncbi:ABC transporter permease [Rhodoferax sediminis]|uniref:ABC transporter permease n=1 Tax=Rhodoferax sediminis TaxID=2509614 RepID=A0A515DAE5_9BURK|nr:ABC transporter permease [Rhodoferax sediminis]QDL37374.1 ABC transporter permease [Rhodoferax sediminis]